MHNTAILMLFLALGLAGGSAMPSFAEGNSAYLSEEEAKRIYEAAAKKMRGKAADVEFSEVEMSAPVVAVEEIAEVPAEEVTAKVVVDESPSAATHDIVMGVSKGDMDASAAAYVPLGDIQLAVDVENETIRQIVDDIIIQGREKAGPWHVKWRLRKENEFLLSEKVNLTAESSFNEFVNYLVDRVNNMTGVHLFVTMFDASRIIVISDTYY